MVKPTHYTIRIEPDFQTFIFKGTVQIVIQSDEPVREVLLNAKELTFHSCVTMDKSDSSNIKNHTDCGLDYNEEKQEVCIRFSQPLKGNIDLTINYSGVINDQYAGFYRSKYQHNGQEKIIASTQFEASDARRAFPCFDQPDLKATFDIEFVINKNLIGISNTAILEERNLNNRKKLVRFERTPKMSTYLVFFGIGEFEFLEDPSDQPLVRVVTSIGKKEYGQFALDMARKSLRFGSDYTGVPFPMSKCDYIAVPDSMGAMENFGAIRHCEDDLLVYPDVTSRARATLTAKIIAHEGIHMWFGDLVSPAAWKYLWLNEAFATYFTYVIPHHYYPEWGVWEQFFHERLLSGMERDSLANTIPIDLPNVEDPNADPAPTPSTAPIVYNKGAAVIRMLAAYLGEDVFRQALHDFLVQYQFDAVSSAQFWTAIEHSSDIPLQEFAKTWITQPGYPLVTAENTGSGIRLIQKRFCYSDIESDSDWVIPVDLLLFLEDGAVQTRKVIFETKSLDLDLPENILAYKLNTGFTGFYRVDYPDEISIQLGKLIKTKKLSAVDSLNVINDYFAMVKAGMYSVTEYLRYVETYLAGEDRYLPLIDLANSLSYLYRVVHAERAEISRLGNAIFEQVLDIIGYLPTEDEGLLVTEMRTTLLSTALLLGSDAVSEFGRVQFQSLLDGETVHRDILSVVLKIGAVIHPEAADWLKALALNTNLPEGERIKALQALGNLDQKETLKEVLTLNMEAIPSSLRHHLLGEASYNTSAFDWLWDWFVANLSQAEKEIPLSYIQAITVRLAPLSGIGRLQEVENCLQDFITRHSTAEDSIAMALELLVLNERIQN